MGSEEANEEGKKGGDITSHYECRELPPSRARFTEEDTFLQLCVHLPFQGGNRERYARVVSSRTQSKVSSGSFCCRAGLKINCSLLNKFRVHQPSDAVRAWGSLLWTQVPRRPSSGCRRHMSKGAAFGSREHWRPPTGHSVACLPILHNFSEKVGGNQ